MGAGFHRGLVAVGATLCVALPSHADLVSIAPSRDATIYADGDGAQANGAGQALFVGRTNQALTRRSLLSFDIASALPAGAEITAARLVLVIVQANGGNRVVTLHRATTAWTTGASDPDGTESIGAAPLAGDATWLHASYDPFGPGSVWMSAGGDFAAAASASTLTTTAGAQIWESAGLLDDVRAFAVNPQANLGWFLLGDESVAGTARRFDSAESAALGGIAPRLEIEFTVVPAPGSLALLGAAAMLLRRRGAPR